MAGFTLPHLLGVRRVAPPTAIVIWLCALTLRVLAIILAAAWLLMSFPATHLFAVVTHWCWHHLIPTTLDGHDVGHLTAIAPVLLGAASLLSVGFASLRLARGLRRVASHARSGGPAGSVIVGGADVAMGVVGFLRPRVLVSAGALLRLNDDELEAALAHERAHIARRHRYWQSYGSACAAISRLIPGTRTALDELVFHLERDADRSALADHVDRRALAAALRKATKGEKNLALALGGSRLEDRVQEILSDAPARRTLLWPGLAALLVALVMGLAASVPSALAAGVHHPHGTGVELDCD